MNAEYLSIKQLFSPQDRRFVVPVYQRAYTWDDNQLTQFMDDLRQCEHDYYLGHFLFEPGAEGFNIIDGQQRLTTCVIFFSVAAHTLKQRINRAEIEQRIKELTDCYIKSLTHKRQKLCTVDYDNNFFVNVIIDYEQIDDSDIIDSKSQKAILNARNFFANKLKTLTVQQILSIVDVLEQAHITYVLIANKLYASQIFIYQNDRGKQLTNLEIVKSYFILQILRSEKEKNSNSDIINYIEKSFADIYKNIVLLKNVSEDEVLNYFWQALYAKYGNESTIDEIKQWLNELTKEEQIEKIKTFVRDLARTFAIVLNIEKDTSFYIANLKCMNHMSLAYPILIKVKMLNVRPEVFERMVKLLENLTFRFLTIGGRTNKNSRLNIILKALKSEAACDKIIDNVKAWLNDDYFWSYWSDKELYHIIDEYYLYNSGVTKYLLWRYEQYLRDDNYPLGNGTYKDVIRNVNIEHIAPQTMYEPSDNGYGEELYEDEENSGWLHRIGNLMLIAGNENSSLGNRSFEEKLEVYGEKGHLSQQNEIREFVRSKRHPVWNYASIKKRQKKILAAAEEIWNLDNI